MPPSRPSKFDLPALAAQDHVLAALQLFRRVADAGAQPPARAVPARTEKLLSPWRSVPEVARFIATVKEGDGGLFCGFWKACETMLLCLRSGCSGAWETSKVASRMALDACSEVTQVYTACLKAKFLNLRTRAQLLADVWCSVGHFCQ